MRPMALLAVTLFAILIFIPLAAAWFANRAGLFAASIGKVARVINFPLSRDSAHSSHRHFDAA